MCDLDLSQGPLPRRHPCCCPSGLGPRAACLFVRPHGDPEQGPACSHLDGRPGPEVLLRSARGAAPRRGTSLFSREIQKRFHPVLTASRTAGERGRSEFEQRGFRGGSRVPRSTSARGLIPEKRCASLDLCFWQEFAFKLLKSK